MRNFFNFLLKYSKWFVFAVYVVLSCMLLVQGSAFRQSVYLSSANAVTGTIFETASDVTGYFNLREINNSLQASNARLENEVLNLRQQLAEYKAIADDTASSNGFHKRFDYESATVINNNIRHPKNFFTINKGMLNGIRPGMGVVDQNGIVGIVNVSGDKISRVISVLNEAQNFSVKIKDSSFYGTLYWKGGDPMIAFVGEVPRHAVYSIGDTIVTSGHSTTFPEGLPVGVIMNRVNDTEDSFFTFKVKLLSNFKSLSTVRIIKDVYKSEIDSLEQLSTLR